MLLLSQSETEQISSAQIRKVAISGYHDYEIALSSLLPSNTNRSFEIHNLLKSYEEIFSKLELLPLYVATKEEICKFHDRAFVNALLRKRKCDDFTGVKSEVLEILKKYITADEDLNYVTYQDDEKEMQVYGLSYDCPIFPYLPQYVKSLVGTSLIAARYLIKNHQSSSKVTNGQTIAINWNGGRHHSKKAQASGFCYINDITLSILELRRKFDRVAYIDLDLHHGDGVENAFKFSGKVLTISLHRKEIGFFPGTGNLEDQGLGKGKGWTVNLPMMHGLGDGNLLFLINEIITPILKKSEIECLVVQCGGDGLGSDDYKEWNLSIKGFGEAIHELLSLNLPTLLLGGGGYDNSQMARLYTYLTAIAVDKKDYEFDILPEAGTLDMDDTDGQYEFWNVSSLKMKDENSKEYLNHLKKTVLSRFSV